MHAMLHGPPPVAPFFTPRAGVHVYQKATPDTVYLGGDGRFNLEPCSCCQAPASMLMPHGIDRVVNELGHSDFYATTACKHCNKCKRDMTLGVRRDAMQRNIALQQRALATLDQMLGRAEA